MDLYIVEASENHVVAVDIKYPGIGYKITNFQLNEGEAQANIAAVTPVGAEVQPYEIPEDIDAHAGEVFKEFLILLEKQVQDQLQLP